FSIGKNNANRRAIFHADLNYLRATADFRARLPGSRSHRLSYGTHPTSGKPGRPRGLRIASCANEQDQATSRRPRAKKGAEDSAGCDGGSKQLSFKVFSYQIGHSHRAPAQKPVHILLAQIPDL